MMCMHLYVYMYIFKYMHVLHMCVFVCACVHVYMCMYVYVCACMSFVYIYTCVYYMCIIHVYACLYVYMLFQRELSGAKYHTVNCQMHVTVADLGDTSLLALRGPADHLCLPATLLLCSGDFCY